MIASLIENLGLLNHSHMVKSTIQFELRDNFIGDIVVKYYDVTTFISKYLYFNTTWNR